MSAAHQLDDDLDVSPLDLSEFTPEQQAEIQESLASLAVGRTRTVPHEEVQRALDEMRAQQGA
jgi:hypothetical protein